MEHKINFSVIIFFSFLFFGSIRSMERPLTEEAEMQEAIRLSLLPATGQEALGFQTNAGVITATPTWVTQRSLETKPDQYWWRTGPVVNPRSNFFEDVTDKTESKFRQDYKWSLTNLFNLSKINHDWVSTYPRRAAIFSGVDDGSKTGLVSLKDLKLATQSVKTTGERPYFSILVYDPYIPWETDIRYLQSIPQNRNAVFQIASTFFGPLEGGVAKEGSFLGSMFPHAVQGEEASAAVAGSVIWRKYIMPTTPLYLLRYIKDKFPLYFGTKSKPKLTINKDVVGKYVYTPGDEDRVSIFIQDNAVVTGGYGNVEARGCKGGGAQQRLEVYTNPDYSIDRKKSQMVTQIFTSALNLKHYRKSGKMTPQVESAAKILLNASYQATILAAAYTKKSRLYLTMLGGGAFANDVLWIGQAMVQPECLDTIKKYGLQVTALYHPDKIREGAKVSRNSKTDLQFFKSLLQAYDAINGTTLRSDHNVQELVENYLDAAYAFMANPQDQSLEFMLHLFAQELNSILMWQPYSGKYI